uniref:Uncharacterized protein n=1 Tax=Physcomitrium patens TaxID=3218 RepID=A0A7I3Z293_PHYPA
MDPALPPPLCPAAAAWPRTEVDYKWRRGPLQKTLASPTMVFHGYVKLALVWFEVSQNAGSRRCNCCKLAAPLSRSVRCLQSPVAKLPRLVMKFSFAGPSLANSVGCITVIVDTMYALRELGFRKSAPAFFSMRLCVPSWCILLATFFSIELDDCAFVATLQFES